MCGRFALRNPYKIAGHFNLKEMPDLPPRYNIAPSQEVAAVRFLPNAPTRELVLLKWGLIPFWAKDKKIAYKMINARAETVADKPAFRGAFRHHRCLIPASGFYEWGHKNKTKQPYFIKLKDSAIFSLAGLWEHWEGDGGEVIESCTIITTAANKTVGNMHDRMPVIVKPEQYDTWLSSETEKNSLKSLLVPFPDEEMFAYPVGLEVNNPRNDNPNCLEEVKFN